MTLNRQSNLLAWLGLFALLVVLLVTTLSAYDVRRQTKEILSAEETAKSITHFRFLILETALHREPRSRLQWDQSIASFHRLLATRRYTEDLENALLKKEQANLAVLERLYKRLVSSTALALTFPDPDDPARVAVASTLSALFLTTQEMTDDAFELIRLNRVGLEASQDRAARLTLLSIILMTGLIVAGFMIIKRRVLLPLAALQDATQLVKQGDLSHRVALAIDNEIGRLAVSFNRMTAQLEGSRSALTNENAERRNTQESLQATISQLAAKSAELEHAQHELQTIIDNTPAIVVSWDSELRNRFANSAYEEWFGIRPTDMRARHMRDIIGDDRYTAVEPYLKQVLAGHQQVFEDVVTLASGEVRNTLYSYVPNIENGRVMGLYGFISDITQLKQAQSAQAAALAQLQGIVEAASDFAIIATDLRGLVTLFSTGAERMLGYRAAEVTHGTLPAAMHDAAEIEKVSLELSAAAGRPIVGFDVFTYEALQQGSSAREWTYVCKDGSRLPVNLTLTALRDNAGMPIGFLSIAQDIREEKSIRRNLAAARDQAEFANLTKSRFLANMSHEIRTPMNAILGMLQLLQHTPLSKLQLDYAAKAQSAAQSLLGLLNDILDFSKIEADKLSLECAPFRVDTLMRDLAVVLSANAADDAVEVLFSIDSQLPKILQGDVLRLRQVLLNLAGNAIKFTQRGEIVVALDVVAQDSSQVTVGFSVRDTGIGIPADQLSTIFAGFSQAESSTTRRFGGTGLGLAISQNLVRLMGGVLTVQSEPGRGSTFAFSVRFEQVSGAASGTLDGPSPTLVLAPTLQRDTTRPTRVLIIDDNRSARSILLAMVASLGWQGQGSESGPAALALLGAQRDMHPDVAFGFDTVLIDWRMEAMDGWEVAREVRRLASHHPVTILLTVSVQARAHLATRNAELLGPVDGFLVKPVTASMLFEAASEAAAGAANASQQPPSMRGSNRLEGLRLLVVDDNAMNQQVARELLVRQGAQVDVANGGVAAVERILRSHAGFDVVLMDIQMPDMDGYEATRQIRLDPGMAGLPIIAMTANAMASDRAACLAAGMNDHVGKPINLDRLVETILLHAGRTVLAAVCSNSIPTSQMALTDRSATPASVSIEFDKAVQRLGGSRELYFSMVSHFTADSHGILKGLAHACAQGKVIEAANLLHNFKSASGIVGAHLLHAAVTRHEASLRASAAGAADGIDAAHAEAMLAELTDLTRQCQLELTTLEQSESSASMAQPRPELADALHLPAAVDTAQAKHGVRELHDMLTHLQTLLSESNMRAFGVFSKIEQEHGAYGVMPGAELTALAGCIGRLDFKQALAACQALQQSLARASQT